jgi:hypothetical protein
MKEGNAFSGVVGKEIIAEMTATPQQDRYPLEEFVGGGPLWPPRQMKARLSQKKGRPRRAALTSRLSFL